MWCSSPYPRSWTPSWRRRGSTPCTRTCPPRSPSPSGKVLLVEAPAGLLPLVPRLSSWSVICRRSAASAADFCCYSFAVKPKGAGWHALAAGLERGSPEYERLKEQRAEVLWRGVERIIPDIRQRAEVQMVCQPSNAVSYVLVLVLAHSRLKGYMLHRDQPGGVWLRSGWHAANAPALPPAAQRDVRARHQGRAGDIPWPKPPPSQVHVARACHSLQPVMSGCCCA